MRAKSDSYTLSCRSAALPYPKHGRRRMPASMRSLCKTQNCTRYSEYYFTKCLFCTWLLPWQQAAAHKRQLPPSSAASGMRRECASHDSSRPMRGLTHTWHREKAQETQRLTQHNMKSLDHEHIYTSTFQKFTSFRSSLQVWVHYQQKRRRCKIQQIAASQQQHSSSSSATVVAPQPQLRHPR